MIRTEKKLPVIFIVGPTAAGKSEIGLALAKRLKTEIISCDSMQMYRGLNIGTAKPTRSEQQQVKHHLIDIAGPRAQLSVFRFRKLALDAIRKITKKNKIPLVVGGSGFYVKAIVDGIADAPGVDVKTRKKLEQESVTKGSAFLHAKLQKLDPERAEAIHPNDQKRIVRALEVYETSRKVPSTFKKTRTLLDEGFQAFLIGIDRDRKELYDRVEKRVDDMLAAGWVREVKALKKTGFSKTAGEAIGYKELLAHLKNQISLEDAVLEIKKRTRHLVKKQSTWFKHDSRIQWFEISGKKQITKHLKKIITFLHRHHAI